MVIAADPPVWIGTLAFALDSLSRANQEDGCCNICCAACVSIRELKETGLLDYYAKMCVTEYGESDWWDSGFDKVSTYFLKQAWRLTETCPHYGQ